MTLLTTARLLAMGHITELTMTHVPDIIKLMKTKRDKTIVQKNGCAALWDLAANDDNQKPIAKMGGIKVILDAMKRHEANADVQNNGCVALLNLTANDFDNQKTIAKMSGIKAVSYTHLTLPTICSV